MDQFHCSNDVSMGLATGTSASGTAVLGFLNTRHILTTRATPSLLIYLVTLLITHSTSFLRCAIGLFTFLFAELFAMLEWWDDQSYTNTCQHIFNEEAFICQNFISRL